MKLFAANIALVSRVFASILVVVSSALASDAQQRPLTAADFPKVIPKVDEALKGLKGKDLRERLLLTPYDGTALRFALSNTSPGFLKGTSADELISGLSSLRAESMKEILPGIHAPLNYRGTSGVRTQVPGAMLHHRSHAFTQLLMVHPLAFFTAVYHEASPLSYGATFAERPEFKDDNYSLTAVNEYEYVINGMTANVREEITTSTETRYIRMRHVTRTTVEQNDDPKAVGRYVVERGTMDSKSNEIKSVHPRRLRATSTHRVTTEIINEAKVERCPTQSGITQGETLCSITIRGTAAAMNNGSPLFSETVSPGKITGHVNDEATLTGFDWEVSSQSRLESLNQGENFRLGHTQTLHAQNMHADPAFSAEVGELVVSGVGSNEAGRKIYKMHEAASMASAGLVLALLDQAEEGWRGGKCVELVVASGAEPVRLQPGETRKLVVDARHLYDPPPIAVPVIGSPAGGTLTPTIPVKTPTATFTFKSDQDGEGGGGVTFKSVSRRGIARDLFVGFIPKAKTPIKVSVSYFQNETRTLKRATLPGVDVEGGNEIEQTNMSHTSILYHYPSASALKKGYLLTVENDDPEPDSKTEYFMEVGHFNFTKKVEDAKIFVIVADKRVPAEVEKGSMSTYNGTASLKHPSQMFFFKGDAGNPPQFSWNVQYPAQNGQDIAAGGAHLEKGADGVKWTVTKITDPNSPYKTEYLLELTLDAAQEFKKGNKAMKDLFGFDLDGLTKAIDPTKPKDNMAGASGSQSVTVRILSPYPDE